MCNLTHICINVNCLTIDCVCMCVPQREVLSLQKSIQGSSFDTEYAIKYVVLSMYSLPH